MFLALSTFIEFLCIFLYAMYFSKLPIVKHYRSKAASEGSKTVMADLAAGGIQTQVDIEVMQNFFNLTPFFFYLHKCILEDSLHLLTNFSIFTGNSTTIDH